jgi:hypothetical protein
VRQQCRIDDGRTPAHHRVWTDDDHDRIDDGMNQHESGLEAGLELRPEDRDASHQRVDPDLRELGSGGDQRCTGGPTGVETGAEVAGGAWIGLLTGRA